jgi:hypothetical protein
MRDYPIASKMSIHEKINYRFNAWHYLRFEQYLQLVNLKKLILAPYYNDRLIQQSKQVAKIENFKSVFGCYEYEYENGIIPRK